MTNTEILTIILSIVAIVVAFWQGWLSKSQLEQAKETKNETERLLDDIKEKVSKIEIISDETRKDMKEQIAKLIDKQDENFKTVLNAPKESSQNEMLMKLLPSLLEKPELLATLIQMGQQK